MKLWVNICLRKYWPREFRSQNFIHWFWVNVCFGAAAAPARYTYPYHLECFFFPLNAWRSKICWLFRVLKEPVSLIFYIPCKSLFWALKKKNLFEIKNEIWKKTISIFCTQRSRGNVFLWRSTIFSCYAATAVKFREIVKVMCFWSVASFWILILFYFHVDWLYLYFEEHIHTL